MVPRYCTVVSVGGVLSIIYRGWDRLDKTVGSESGGKNSSPVLLNLYSSFPALLEFPC